MSTLGAGIRVPKWQDLEVEDLRYHLISNCQQDAQVASPHAPLTGSQGKGYIIPKRKHSRSRGCVQTYEPRNVQSEAVYKKKFPLFTGNEYSMDWSHQKTLFWNKYWPLIAPPATATRPSSTQSLSSLKARGFKHHSTCGDKQAGVS